MSAHLTDLRLAAADWAWEQRFQLVSEHWGAVQRLWINNKPSAVCDGLPRDFWVGCGVPGLANIRSAHEGGFEFAEDGQEALIVPAYSTVPGLLAANAERHIEHIVDLIAVDPEQPARFWRRRGEALILGAAYLDIARQEGEPLPVYRNPLTWLQSGGGGIVVLDWDWVPDLMLGLDLIAENVELGNQLEAALKPDIWVMENAA